MIELNFLSEMGEYVVQEGFFFPLTRTVSVWLGHRAPLFHSASILGSQTTSQAGSLQPVSAQRSLTPGSADGPQSMLLQVLRWSQVLHKDQSAGVTLVSIK